MQLSLCLVHTTPHMFRLYNFNFQNLIFIKRLIFHDYPISVNETACSTKYGIGSSNYASFKNLIDNAFKICQGVEILFFCSSRLITYMTGFSVVRKLFQQILFLEFSKLRTSNKILKAAFPKKRWLATIIFCFSFIV